MLTMPERSVHVSFFVDTNRINSRQQLTNMNQLEEWYKKGVIVLEMPEEAYREAARGNAQRAQKAKYDYSRPLTKPWMRRQAIRKDIEKALFPSGVKSANERNDVDIVLNTRFYLGILVTNDGDSLRQPRGILGSREELAELGITVMRDSDAVALVRRKIRERDNMAQEISRRTGQPLPEWVGKD
jgi:hypothetical protein